MVLDYFPPITILINKQGHTVEFFSPPHPPLPSQELKYIQFQNKHVLDISGLIFC